jgi:hypothetical protein
MLTDAVLCCTLPNMTTSCLAPPLHVGLSSPSTQGRLTLKPYDREQQASDLRVPPKPSQYPGTRSCSQTTLASSNDTLVEKITSPSALPRPQMPLIPVDSGLGGSGTKIITIHAFRHWYPTLTDVFVPKIERFVPLPDLKPSGTWREDQSLPYLVEQLTLITTWKDLSVRDAEIIRLLPMAFADSIRSFAKNHIQQALFYDKPASEKYQRLTQNWLKIEFVFTALLKSIVAGVARRLRQDTSSCWDHFSELIAIHLGSMDCIICPPYLEEECNLRMNQRKLATQREGFSACIQYNSGYDLNILRSPDFLTLQLIEHTPIEGKYIIIVPTYRYGGGVAGEQSSNITYSLDSNIPWLTRQDNAWSGYIPSFDSLTEWSTPDDDIRAVTMIFSATLIEKGYGRPSLKRTVRARITLNIRRAIEASLDVSPAKQHIQHQNFLLAHSMEMLRKWHKTRLSTFEKLEPIDPTKPFIIAPPNAEEAMGRTDVPLQDRHYCCPTASLREASVKKQAGADLPDSLSSSTAKRKSPDGQAGGEEPPPKRPLTLVDLCKLYDEAVDGNKKTGKGKSEAIEGNRKTGKAKSRKQTEQPLVFSPKRSSDGSGDKEVEFDHDLSIELSLSNKLANLSLSPQKRKPGTERTILDPYGRRRNKIRGLRGYPSGAEVLQQLDGEGAFGANQYALLDGNEENMY